MGFNRHFPQAVIFGPEKYQGKQMTDYATYQYTAHLELMGYIRQGEEIGNLLGIHIDQYQQLIGCQTNFLLHKSSEYT